MYPDVPMSITVVYLGVLISVSISIRVWPPQIVRTVRNTMKHLKTQGEKVRMHR
jgi:hypothetical protein